jgi:competence protein ComEC
MPDTFDSNGLRQIIEQTHPQKVTLLQDTTHLNLDGGEIALLPAKSGTSDNESSVCVLFQAENCDILITGDRSIAGERALLKKADLPDLELLVVGHHGSKNSTSYDLLSETRPKTAVISVEEDNRYEMPAEETLQRLKNMGVTVWRTDLQGTLIFRG